MSVSIGGQINDLATLNRCRFACYIEILRDTNDERYEKMNEI